ncbi:MAG: T9SS type A sorting domain-containing protein [Bernardetiaceae bacterium]|nr:T9SS type A sorting domain-containing protein [Bernardetiaceae bacterium]
MTSKFYVYLLCAWFFLFIANEASAQCTFTSTGTGNWDNPATWSSTGTGCGTTPGPDDHVIIAAGHTVTLNGGETVQVASILVQRTGNNGGTLVVAGAGTHLIIGPEGGTDQNVLVMENNTDMIIDGAIVQVTGALGIQNNGNIITSGDNEGYLLVENCARQGGNSTTIGAVSTGCANNITNSTTLVYCVRCEGCESDSLGVQDQSNINGMGGCETLDDLLLPVEWYYFEAKYDAPSQSVILTWGTLSETDNAFFEVERSLDGFSFQVIDKQVPVRAHSSQIQHYRSRDTELANANKIYYRIKQTDIDGTFSYSRIAVVILPSDLNHSTFKLYPNPNKGQDLYYHSNDKVLRIQIVDMLGKSISFREENTRSEDMNHCAHIQFQQKLSKGTYILQVYTRLGVESRKFVVE